VKGERVRSRCCGENSRKNTSLLLSGSLFEKKEETTNILEEKKGLGKPEKTDEGDRFSPIHVGEGGISKKTTLGEIVTFVRRGENVWMSNHGVQRNVDGGPDLEGVPTDAAGGGLGTDEGTILRVG